MRPLTTGRSRRPGNLADALNSAVARRRRLEKRGAVAPASVRMPVLGGPSSAQAMERQPAP